LTRPPSTTYVVTFATVGDRVAAHRQPVDKACRLRAENLRGQPRVDALDEPWCL